MNDWMQRAAAILLFSLCACSDDAASSGGGGTAGTGGEGAGGEGTGATGGAGGAPATRAFSMGLTAWPWDATAEAVEWTWSHVLAEGDLVSQHIEEGVPWTEVAAGRPFPASFQAMIDDRVTRAAGHQQLLSINPLDPSRSHLAPFRTEQINAPLSPPWSDYALDDPAVEQAFLDYAVRMIDLFQPDFVQTGIEVNVLLRDTDPETFARYVALQCYVYHGLKDMGYSQPIGVSLISQSFYHPDIYAPENDIAEQLDGLAALEPCVDVVAWSVYPYMSGLFADEVPGDYFETLLALTEKPQAISESGFPAQPFTLDGLGTWEGTPEKQEAFVRMELQAAETHRLSYLVWFCVRDYDALYSRPTSEGGLGEIPIALVFRDDGLYDEAGVERPALALWTGELAIARP